MSVLLSLVPWWGRAIALAALIAVLTGFGWIKGNAHGTQKLLDYQGVQAAATLKLMQARETVVTKIQTKYVDRIQTVYAQGQTIEKEVPIYVTQTDDAGCTVPAGFVREYNAAWSGSPPGPAAESDRRPAGVPLSEVAATDAGNATTCLALKAQRDGLIEFYRSLQALEAP